MIGIDELFVAMRLGVEGDTIRADLREYLEDLRGSALAMISKYAPDAPDRIQHLAVIQFATYVNDTSRDNTTANVFRLSGAQATLSDWHVPTLTTAEDT